MAHANNDKLPEDHCCERPLPKEHGTADKVRPEIIDILIEREPVDPTDLSATKSFKTCLSCVHQNYCSMKKTIDQFDNQLKFISCTDSTGHLRTNLYHQISHHCVGHERINDPLFR